jgi:hypothetical protein
MGEPFIPDAGEEKGAFRNGEWSDEGQDGTDTEETRGLAVCVWGILAMGCSGWTCLNRAGCRGQQGSSRSQHSWTPRKILVREPLQDLGCSACVPEGG